MWFYIYNVLYNPSYNYIHRRSLTSRMFGTFQPGRTQPFSSLLHYTTQEMIIFHAYFFARFVQTFYFVKLYKKFKSMNGWKNKLYSLIKGPGWTPGSRWTGNPDNIPDVSFLQIK